MKTTIQLDIEISDQYLENWNKDFLNYHNELYHDSKKAEQVLKENPYEKSLASWIEDQIIDYHPKVVKSCKASIIKTDTVNK